MLESLEERFTKPLGWTSETFRNPVTSHDIYHASVSPPAPQAAVVVLGGLSEFSEKYFELSRDMLARNFSFFTMDWAHQGRSSRASSKSEGPRRSDGFEADLSDLHKFVCEYVRPRIALPGNKHLPLILIAHSMGGMIGLRYLSEHTGNFNAAAFSAPFLGVPKISWLERALLTGLNAFDSTRTNYIPNMGKDWNEGRRSGDGTQEFSSDPKRDYIHPAWSIHDSILRVGDFSVGWIYEALQSFKKIENPGTLEKINIPVLLAIAENDTIVSNAAIRNAAARLKNRKLIEIDGAKHEILMESDAQRNQFMAAFDKLLQENNIIPSP